MTLHQTIHGRAGSDPNKALPEAAPDADQPHAYASNGDLFILDGGVYWRFDSLSAWSRWCDAALSPFPLAQERARQIRAAMDEAFPQEKAA